MASIKEIIFDEKTLKEKFWKEKKFSCESMFDFVLFSFIRDWYYFVGTSWEKSYNEKSGLEFDIDIDNKSREVEWIKLKCITDVEEYKLFIRKNFPFLIWQKIRFSIRSKSQYIISYIGDDDTEIDNITFIL